MLFGELVPLKEFYKQHPLKKNPAPCSLIPATSKILKKILEEYATPIFDAYSKKL
jgi:hypothetical protein